VNQAINDNFINLENRENGEKNIKEDLNEKLNEKRKKKKKKKMVSFDVTNYIDNI
jgi:hypothetical protein